MFSMLSRFTARVKYLLQEITAITLARTWTLDKGCFPSCKVFWKFQSEFKWKGPDSILVSSEWNIWNHIWRWPAYFGHNIPNEIHCSFFDKLVCALIREFRKGIKHGKNHSLIHWPGLIGKFCSIFLGYSHWSLTNWFGMMESSHRVQHVNHWATTSPIIFLYALKLCNEI